MGRQGASRVIGSKTSGNLGEEKWSCGGEGRKKDGERFRERGKSIAWRLTGEGAEKGNRDACLWVRYV